MRWLRRRRQQDLDRELRSHLELEAQEQQQTGLPPDEARHAARRAFGNATQVKEDVREAWGWAFLDRLRQDLVYAFRGMRKSPAFTATAVLSLALGIGANTAIFSLIDAVLLRWLPVRDPQGLSQLIVRRAGDPLDSFSYPLAQALAAHREIFSELCAFSGAQFAVRSGELVESTSGAWVSGGYYTTLGLQAAAGRLLTEADDRAGATPVAVITDDYWRRKFNRSSAVIGQPIRLEGKPVIIVGVSPAGFNGADVGQTADITLPLGVLPQILPDRQYLIDNSSRWLRILARLRPGINREQPKSRLVVVWSSLRDILIPPGMPADTRRRMEQSTPDLVPGATGYTDLRRQFRKPLLVLMAVVGLLLLIACANVANLLLARASARQREIATRLAIGASRMRVVRQLLTESLLLSVFGAGLGVLLASSGSRALVHMLSSGQFRAIVLDVSPDWLVFAFTAAAAGVTSALFGLAPAFRATAPGPVGVLRERISIGRSRLAPLLVIAQVSLAFLLLSGGGLFLETLLNLSRVEPGFRADGVLVANADGAREGYRGANAATFYERLLGDIERLPGVQSAGYSLITPLAGGGISQDVAVNGRAVSESQIYFNSISRRYFETLGTPVVLGREFTAHDTAHAPRVAIVNRAFARLYLPSGPLGQHLTVGSRFRLDFDVVGVVADSIYESLRQAAPPTVYTLIQQREAMVNAGFGVVFEARAAGSPAQVAEVLRSTLQPMLPGSAVEVHALNDQIERALVRERVMATLAAGFGILGLVLAAIGLYGLLAYTVAQRTNEIGVRLAIGATREAVLWMTLRHVLGLLGAGIAIGIPAAWACSRLVSSMLFGVTASDPATSVAVTAILAVTGLIAGFLPAWRASRVDPMTALRYE